MLTLLFAFATVAPAQAMGKRPPQDPACAVPIRATSGQENPVALPELLSQTGLNAPGVRSYSVKYPLWTDGAEKRRWISLPEGSKICTENVDRWKFPVGTRLFKEFAFSGKPIETRVMQKNADGSWSYGAYVWNADGTDARFTAYPTAQPLPDGGSHTPPPVSDCRTCHEQNQRGSKRANNDPVLGFDALQLQETGLLDQLANEGRLTHSPTIRPVILARNELEKRALGTLHSNCGHCHNDTGFASFTKLRLRYAFTGLKKREDAPVFRTALRSDYPGSDTWFIRPGDPERSAVYHRVRSGSMPFLGITRPDPSFVALLEQWIRSL